MMAAADRMPFHVPLRWTAITWSNCSSVILRIVASRVIPALLTMMSRPPNRSTAAATNASTSAAEVTSHRTAAATSAPPEPGGCGLGRCQVEITQHHPGALGHEPLGDRQAQTLRSAGHDRSTTCQQRHVITRPQCSSAGT